MKADGSSGYITKQYIDAGAQALLLGWMEHEGQE